MKRHCISSCLRPEPIRGDVSPVGTATVGRHPHSAVQPAVRFLSELVLCLLLAIPITAWAKADPGVVAHVDRTVLAPGESVRLTVTIQDGSGDVDIDQLTDFRVLSRGTSASLQIVNGASSREEDHTYLLIPRRKGRLTIPALSVSVDGRSLQTEPIVITVTNQGQDAGARQQKDVWVESALSEAHPFVGQQVIYTFSLYQSVQVTDATFKAPDFSGFSAAEIKKRDTERKTIDGREYLVTHIRYVLIALEAGRHDIAPAVLQLGILRPGMQRRRSAFDDFFNDPFFNRNRVEPQVLQSNPLKLQVRPLPPYAGTEPFSGLVGRFEISANLEDNHLNVGDSTTLTLSVRGQGNIMDAQAPTLQMPDTLKSYIDSPEEKIQLKPTGYSGQKTYRTALVPLKAGGIQLPAVHLTYFDVGQERYRTLTTALPALTVDPAADAKAAPMTVTAQPHGPAKQEVAFKGHDILPPKDDLRALQSHGTLAWPLFLVWMGIPVLAFGALCTAQYLWRRDTSPKARMRSKALGALKTARMAGNARDPFLTALYQSLSAAIFAYAGRGGEALTWKEAETLLREHGLDSATAREAAGLLAAIETQKFSGAQLPADSRHDLFDRTRRMIRRLVP